MPKITICFHTMGNDAWHAGVTYLTGLLRSLRETCPEHLVKCLLLASAEQRLPDELGEVVDEVLVNPTLRRWTPLWVLDRVARRVLSYDLVDSRFLSRRHVDVVAFGEAPRGSGIPALGWLPDFQHVHLPEMFSASERQARDRWFTEVAERSARIVLLSEAVSRDFRTFASTHANKVRVVHPVSYVPASAYENEPRAICNVYHLPDKFVYLPNQFWKHKNHNAALRALAILKERGVEAFLVLSGFPGDYRHSHYFADLLRALSEWNIRSQVALLGLVPRHHVFALIRQSLCVLNPSFFEGYGMTVEEARSVGKQVLLSDIPVHREQNPPRATYFDPRDWDELAGKLGKIWRDKSPGPDKELEEEARNSLPERVRRYGQSFLSVVREVLYG